MNAMRLINGNNHNSNKTVNGTYSTTTTRALTDSAKASQFGLIYDHNNGKSRAPDASCRPDHQLDCCLKLSATSNRCSGSTARDLGQVIDNSDGQSSAGTVTQPSHLDGSISPSSGQLNTQDQSQLFTCHLNQSSVGSSSTLTSSVGGVTCPSLVGASADVTTTEPISISPMGTGNVIAVAASHHQVSNGFVGRKPTLLGGTNGTLRKGVS